MKTQEQIIEKLKKISNKGSNVQGTAGLNTAGQEKREEEIREYTRGEVAGELLKWIGEKQLKKRGLTFTESLIEELGIQIRANLKGRIIKIN